MSDSEHLNRLASIWRDSPNTRADVEDRYPGLAWAIESVINAFGDEVDEPEPKIECPESTCAYSFVGEHRFRELLDHYIHHHREQHGGAARGGVVDVPVTLQMSRDTSELYHEMIRWKPKRRDVDTGVTTDIVRAGDLVLRFARIDRLTRHPDGRCESDTDHTVMLGVIACAFAAEYLPRLNLGKIAQLALAHDLVEAYAGDVHTLRELSPADKARKERDEWVAWNFIKRTITSLPWIADTIEDYDRRSTAEQIYVWAMDKNMPKITHLLNNGVTLRDNDMGRDELADRFEKQRLELKKQIEMSPVDLSPVLDLHVALAERSLKLYDDFDDGGDEQ